MPRGDREKLKADIEDGTTNIAHLLLEALAMADLSGAEKGLVLFLWRRTYGWQDKETGEAFKEDAIPLQDWARAIDSTPSYASRLLKKLITINNVIIRTGYEPGKTPLYKMNTLVETWKGCLNVQGLYERIKQGLYICARVDKAPEQEPSDSEARLKTDLKDSNKDRSKDLPESAFSEAEESDTLDPLTEAYKKAEERKLSIRDEFPNPPKDKDFDGLTKLYDWRFPGQRVMAKLRNPKDRSGTGAIVTARRIFQQAEAQGVPIAVMAEVIYSATEQDLSPWDVVSQAKTLRRMVKNRASPATTDWSRESNKM